MASFEQVIALQLKKWGPEEARRIHIAVARKTLREFMARQGAKPQVLIETDGHPTGTEDAVQPYGIIIYHLSRLREIASFAIRTAEELSPVLSGRYKSSWFLMTTGNVPIGFDEVDAYDAVILVNDQPYHRKIHVGAKGFEKYATPSGIVEKVRQKVRQRYGARGVRTHISFLALNNVSVRSRMRRGPARVNLTYPALVMSLR